jgi:hypothetical protein
MVRYSEGGVSALLETRPRGTWTKVITSEVHKGLSERPDCKLPQKQDSLKVEIYFNHKLLNDEKEQIQSHTDREHTQGV